MTMRTNCDPAGELLSVPQAQAMKNLGKIQYLHCPVKAEQRGR